MPINQVVDAFDEAMEDAEDGSIVHIGGFGGPECITPPAPYVPRVVKRPSTRVISWETPC
jgi:acyl CoA:acetate/3-ketoacid CoA transferase alpha subunit